MLTIGWPDLFNVCSNGGRLRGRTVAGFRARSSDRAAPLTAAAGASYYRGTSQPAGPFPSHQRIPASASATIGATRHQGRRRSDPAAWKEAKATDGIPWAKHIQEIRARSRDFSHEYANDETRYPG